MVEPNAWTEPVAATIAGDEGVDAMPEMHWKIVNFTRSYEDEHDLAPPVRMICKESGLSVRDIYKLFTSGPARGACRSGVWPPASSRASKSGRWSSWCMAPWCGDRGRITSPWTGLFSRMRATAGARPARASACRRGGRRDSGPRQSRRQP
jgi:TusE/DsrC/DsvC family sulfur relay protein